MRKNLYLVLLLSICISTAFAQNEIENREAFTMELPVDGELFYEQKVESTPYFVKENVLQISPLLPNCVASVKIESNK